MTNRERFTAVLNGKPADRLPVVEWASWWNETFSEWQKQGLDEKWTADKLYDYYGLDTLVQAWINHRMPGFPEPKEHGHEIMQDEHDYEHLKKMMFSEEYMHQCMQYFKSIKSQHEAGHFALWYTIEGFFWFPRTLFGIENHLYAFYDYPELMHRINQDQTDYMLMFLEEMHKVVTPDFMTFAEDMSYNHGPMLSKDCYDEFIKPYYREIIPFIKSKGTKVFIDTDGDVEPLIPWFQEAGIEGVLPLERQAGVDVNRIRRNYPEWLMIGGYDKTIMHLGEESMRAEFERLLPAMKSGRYIPSVDHQTPPDVTLDNYKIYVSLLKEYAQKAMQD